MLVYLAVALLAMGVGRGVWMLLVDDDEPVKRLASVLFIASYVAAIYGVLTK